ncbi:hypothetical protein IHE45_16G037500 [Dioscorea alata]|uniref:Uncharacterized protein n=1 Tax=Dioscorea alata TaxID=55571 RepID=A0ACB7UGZ7_DIOAL|nr:hypothetical protein IHE45_16G037500 [Dioscorea alata]
MNHLGFLLAQLPPNHTTIQCLPSTIYKDDVEGSSSQEHPLSLIWKAFCLNECSIEEHYPHTYMYIKRRQKNKKCEGNNRMGLKATHEHVVVTYQAVLPHLTLCMLCHESPLVCFFF